MSAIAASDSARRAAGRPSKKVVSHSIHVSTSPITTRRYGSRPDAARPFASKNGAKRGSASSWARTGHAARECEVVRRGSGERLGQGHLESDADGTHDLTDQVVLGGEVVDDDAVTDSQALREPPERELAQALVEHSVERTLQDVVLAVLVTHRGRSCGRYDQRVQCSLHTEMHYRSETSAHGPPLARE